MIVCFRIVLTSLMMSVPFTVFAKHHSTIYGYLFGNDGKPLRAAHVIVSGTINCTSATGALHPEDFKVVQVDPDGSFSISTDTIGAFSLMFAGVGHKMMQVPFILDHSTDCQIEAHLEIMHLVDNFRDAEVRYSFDETIRGRIAPLKEIAPKVYSAELSTDKPEFRFRFLNIGGCPWGESVLCATADSFEYSFGRTYTSIVHPHEGKVRIILTDTMLRPAPHPEGITFGDSLSLQSRFLNIHQYFEGAKADYDTAMHKHLLAGKTYKSFAYNWEKFAKILKSHFASEREPIIRQELLMQYMEMASLTPKNFDSLFVKRNIRSIPPGSLVWVFHGSTALQANAYHPQGDRYLQQILETHPSRSFRAFLLFGLYETATLQHRRRECRRLFRILTAEYLDTPAGKMAAGMPKPSGSLSVGMKFPRFAFTSVDNPELKYTNADIKGKYTLLDFWGTYCAPCVAEIKYIQNAFEKFQGSNFQILSVALSDTPERVKYIRSNYWAMPWLNGIVRENEAAAVELEFDAMASKPILIGPDGTILAMDTPLAGDKLEKTLLKYLGKKK